MADDLARLLDQLVDALSRDERVLSSRERELLASVLQHAGAAGGESPEQAAALRARLASAVGSAVAGRVMAVIGAQIAGRALGPAIAPVPGPVVAPIGGPGADPPYFPPPPPPPYFPPPPPPPYYPPPPPPPYFPPPPPPPYGPPPPPQPLSPPPPPPEPPGPPPPPEPPGPPPAGPGDPPPGPGGPGDPPPDPGDPGDPPGPDDSILSLVDPYILEAALSMAEVVALIEAVVARQSELVIAREITPAQAPGKFETGQARVLLRVDDLVRRVAGHFAGALPRIYEALQMPGAPAARLSGQIAAINDGESIQFRGAPAGAELTFVLMLHREPKAFSGGELLVHGARLRRGRWVRADEHRSVDVRPGRLVAFPSRYAHEVARVECRSRALADGLFTLTGWLMR